MYIQNTLTIISAALLVCSSPSLGKVRAEGQPGQVGTQPVAETAAETQAKVKLATRAAEILEEIVETPEHSIPLDLLNHAECVAVFPSTLKAGFIVGAKYGYGLVSCRQPESDTWGTPAFFTLAGGSIGLQIGAKAIDLILLVMNEEGMNGLLDSTVTLGADIGVSAGPVGRDASASTDISAQAAILSYSRSEGLFAGVELDGSVLTYDAEATKEVYGHDSGASTILLSRADGGTPTVIFPRTLEKYAPPRLEQKRLSLSSVRSEMTNA